MSSQAFMPTRHPTEDALELYVLQRANRTTLAAVEQHLAGCAECSKRVALLRMFTAGTRSAPRALRERPLRWIHQVPGGALRLEVKGSPHGGWEVTAPGGSPVRFSTLPEANEYLMRSFVKAYPHHQCTDGCGPASNQK